MTTNRAIGNQADGFLTYSKEIEYLPLPSPFHALSMDMTPLVV